MKKLIFFTLTFLFIFNNSYSNTDNLLYEKIDLFGEVLEKVQDEYIDEVDQAEIMDSAINGVLQSLDPYSSYMSPELFKSMQTDTRGEFGGLGIEIGMEAGVVKVISPIDDTPASRAGIESGDLITHLDGEPVLGMTLSEAVSLMRGKAGSKIILTVSRNESETLKIEITRAVIELKAVKSKVQSNIGYIRVSSFNQKVDTEIIKAINKFKKNNEIIGYVLDLRNNPGGLLDQAVNVTDIFLDRGEIVSTRGRFERDGSRYNSIKSDLTGGLPLVVLINQGSASASEIVAGALQDHKRAIIMGTKSFGKGSVQTIIPSGDNVAIKLTTAKYYTPLGRSIQKTGIDPDILVEQAELKKVDQQGQRKESDLRGAIDNDQDSSSKKEKKKKSSKAKKSDESMDDYQLSRAFDLILALDLANNKFKR